MFKLLTIRKQIYYKFLEQFMFWKYSRFSNKKYMLVVDSVKIKITKDLLSFFPTVITKSNVVIKTGTVELGEGMHVFREITENENKHSLLLEYDNIPLESMVRRLDFVKNHQNILG